MLKLVVGRRRYWVGRSTNKDKNIDYYSCDTFAGVVNSSEKDSFFKNLNIVMLYQVMLKVSEIVNTNLNVVEVFFHNL